MVMLDARYQSDHDTVDYVLGSIGRHNVVMGCLPKGQIGTVSAAVFATKMQSRFPALKVGLMVGIGGGFPSSEADIRLGDIVISSPQGEYGGIVHYDYGKTGHEGSFMRTGCLNTPPSSLLTAIALLQADLHSIGKVNAYLQSSCIPAKFKRCSAGSDNLYDSSYNHGGGPTCDQCSRDMLINQAPRENDDVVVHYGTIASGNRVMKDGITRDRLSAQLGGILCFEMEAAGLMNSFPSLVIRGICKYQRPSQILFSYS